MLDGINALLQSFGLIWQAVFSAPLYGDLTWGYFLIATTVMGILISFFVARFK